ncbi:fluoride efflux transporter CrcB [Candidatus Aerophobetes bacterium]|uniref:Fluoride-specific ion channel FluC n=1 Tax=Aerophobetes bacterium TaxID=2030807 RepID=A0A2A4X0W2_UNCAE|nr:MAG: fluoride efflux transporter CrcB [Candidatus Aerophobetes bacterium]
MLCKKRKNHLLVKQSNCFFKRFFSRVFTSFVWIGLGGACGAMARVALMRVLPPFFLNIPLKILLVNVLGCFLIGVLTESMAQYGNLSVSFRHFLVQGFLGGFTTFSAFALEFGLLYEKGFVASSIIYALLSVCLGLVFFFLGFKLIKAFV